MHHPTDRITHTTAFVTPVVEHWLEWEIAQWVHPMKDRSYDPSHHEWMLLPWSYISLQIKFKKWIRRQISLVRAITMNLLMNPAAVSVWTHTCAIVFDQLHTSHGLMCSRFTKWCLWSKAERLLRLLNSENANILTIIN